MNTNIQRAKDNQDLRIRFMPIDSTNIRLAVSCNASFASNVDLTSQLGYAIVIADDSVNVNILNYSRVKSKRVTKIVLAAKRFAAIPAFDLARTL